MHFIHLTYKISQLSHTYLNCARNAQNLQLGKIIKHISLLDSKVLRISCNLLNPILKMKNGVVIWAEALFVNH